MAELESFAWCVIDDALPSVTGLDGLGAFDLAVAVEQAWRAGRAVSVQPRRADDGVVYEMD